MNVTLKKICSGQTKHHVQLKMFFGKRTIKVRVTFVYFFFVYN